MSSRRIIALRSVALGVQLGVPDLAAAEDFYPKVSVSPSPLAARRDGVIYLRGSGAGRPLRVLHAVPGTPTIRQLMLRARSAAAPDAIAQATPADAAGGVVDRLSCCCRTPGRTYSRRRASGNRCLGG